MVGDQRRKKLDDLLEAWGTVEFTTENTEGTERSLQRRDETRAVIVFAGICENKGN